MGVVPEQPRQRYLRRGSVRVCCDGGDDRVAGHLRPARERGAEREERNPGDVVLAAQCKYGLRQAVKDAVGVLHARDAGRPRLPDLAGRDARQADGADLSRLSQRGQLGELIVEADLLVALGDQPGPGIKTPQVDHTHLLHAERGQVDLDLLAQLFRSLRWDEPAVRGPDRANLADQDQLLRVGRQRIANHRVDRAVEVGGVDVIDSCRGCLPQDGQRRVRPLGSSLQLHCPEPDPGDGAAGQLRSATWPKRGAAWPKRGAAWPRRGGARGLSGGRHRWFSVRGIVGHETGGTSGSASVPRTGGSSA